LNFGKRVFFSGDGALVIDRFKDFRRFNNDRTCHTVVQGLSMPEVSHGMIVST
jgi:hypothetical protein